jgi:hypothetical protein
VRRPWLPRASVSPQLTKKPLTDFDNKVWALWLKILGGVGDDQLVCCKKALKRARKRTFLPSRFHGVGLRSWEKAADFAWFTSVASCVGLRDPDFDRARKLLKEQGKAAHRLALHTLGGPKYLEKSKLELISLDPDVLSDSTFYIDLIADNPKTKIRLQHEFQQIVNENEAQKFLSSRSHVNDSEKILLLSLQQCDPENQSLLSRQFTADLSQYDVRLTKTEFVFAARQFVLLPPLRNPRGEIEEFKCGCQYQKCANSGCKSPVEQLDGTGNHATMCHPGVKARRATLLEKAIERCFHRAGGHSTRQPSLYDLFGGYFKKEDLCALFPRSLTKTEADRRKRLVAEYLEILLRYERGRAECKAELGRLREEKFPPRPRHEEQENSMVRFDLKLVTGAPDSPKELWIDHAIVHETCSTYATDVLRFLEASADNDPSCSNAFTKKLMEKKRRYEVVMSTTDRLLGARRLYTQPEFLFPVISSLGFLNDHMVRLLKTIYEKNKQTLLANSRRADGQKLGVLTGKFNRQVKDSICCALLKGNSLGLWNQGMPGGVESPP